MQAGEASDLRQSIVNGVEPSPEQIKGIIAWLREGRTAAKPEPKAAKGKKGSALTADEKQGMLKGLGLIP